MDIDLLENVVDKSTFLIFAKGLLKDRLDNLSLENSNSNKYSPTRGGWENITIENFLESTIHWAEDSDFGSTQGLNEDNLWKKFATFLYCGKIYE